MKKILGLVLLVLIFTVPATSVEASEYLVYQSITFNRPRHKLLHQYDSFEMNGMLNKLGGRRFFGWRTHTQVHHQKVSFLKETLMIIVNDGYSTIDQSFQIKQTEQTRVQFNTSGTIRMKADGKVKGFGLGLDSTLNVSYASDTTVFLEERTDIKVRVEPKTKVAVEIHGEGYVSNGVGAYYAFWRKVREGGWEVFSVATEFYSIVVDPL